MKSKVGWKKTQLHELLLQALETELGGVQVYREAIRCAVHEDLKKEWREYLGQTERHVEIVRGVFQKLGLDAGQESPGRSVVRRIGAVLVESMEAARKAGDPAAAEIVAAECVVLAETKDHLNWELIGECAKQGGAGSAALADAHAEIEDQEDEHLYHTTGWCRELWIDSLGMPSVLPPPEEEKEVKTAIGAARARKAREEML